MYKAQLFNGCQLEHGFLGRLDGLSEKSLYNSKQDCIDHTKKRLAQIYHLSGDSIFSVQQTHSTRCLRIEKKREWAFIAKEQADALWTSEKGIVLTIFTADCVPLIVSDPKTHFVAVIHAGWRGMCAGVIENTIQSIVQELSIKPENMLAAIGPCIHMHDYEVDASTASSFFSYPWKSEILIQREKKFLLNLPQCARFILKNQGLRTVEDLKLNTFSPIFHSYRRDKDEFGRQASFAFLI